MLAIDPAVIVQVAGFGVFLWIGLYLLVRAPGRTPLIIVSAIGMFAQAAYFATGALADTTADLGWFLVLEKGFWWTTVLPVATWFHVSSLIARRPSRPESRRAARLLFTRRVVLVYTAALCITLFGSIGDLIVDYSHVVRVDGRFAVASGPAYPVYIVYLGATAAGALINLARALHRFTRHPQPAAPAIVRQLRLLAGGGLFFLAGGLWIAVRKYWELPVSALPGFLCLFVGLAALAYSIAHFGLLLEGRNIRRDFVYSLTGIALMNLLYVGLLATAGQLSTAGLLALVGLVTATHTAFDSGRAALDRLFFNRDEQAARAEARDYATVLAALPVAAPGLMPEDGLAPPETPIETETAPPQADDEKHFKHAVRRALTSLKSPPRLAQSPLLGLTMVERRVARSGLADNRLNRVAALRELLIEQIEGLRPSDEASARVGDSWRFYNVLYYPYVRELSRKAALAEMRRLAEERRRNGQRAPGDLEQVLSWLADVDEDTFYKWQRRASDTIATMLWEENLKVEHDG
ncbi:MAG: hypothetical protein ACJ8CR_37185 [Roseiflexaceae bacterium]